MSGIDEVPIIRRFLYGAKSVATKTRRHKIKEYYNLCGLVP